jgi:hypothetical protein
MQKFDHNISFWEKKTFVAEFFLEIAKIVIITSTAGQSVVSAYYRVMGSLKVGILT